MASPLQNTISSYAVERSIEFDQAYTTTPTQTGTIASQTFSLTGNAPTRVYDGPSKGAGSCWKFDWTTSSTTNTYYNSNFSAYNATLTDGDYGVGFWIKFDNIPTGTSFYRFFELSHTSGAGGIALDLMGSDSTAGGYTGAKLRAVTGPSGLTFAYSSNTVSIVANKWYYVAARRVGNTGSNYFLYINGTQVANWAENTAGTVFRLIFGKSGSNSQAGSYRIANYHSATSSVLGPTQIAAIYAAGSGGFEDAVANIGVTPLLWYKFDDTSGIDLVYNSAVPGSNTLNLTNNPTWTSYPNTAVKGGISFPSFGGYDTNATATYTLNNTISFWFKRSAPPGSPSQWMYHYFNSAGNITTAQVNTDGKIQFGARLNDSNQPTLVSTSSVCDGNWHLITITRGSNGTEVKLYVDGVLNSTQTYNGFTTSSTGWSPIAGQGNEFDDYIYWDNTTLSAAQVTSLYNSVFAPSIGVSYSAPAMTVTDSTFPMPTHTAETVINVTYNSEALGGNFNTATLINPIISISINADAIGTLTASSDLILPIVDITSNADTYPVAMTAISDLILPVVTTSSSTEIFAVPATASALLSARVFSGDSVQDTSYTLSIREIGLTTNTTGNSGFYIGATKDNNVVSQTNSVAIKPNAGFPVYNKLVKAKFNSAHVSVVQSGDYTPSNYFKVYVFTENPATSFDTMNFSNLPAKEYIFTTRLVDDGSNNQYYLDLTPALSDIRAHTYGIYIELDLDTVGGSGVGTYWDRTQWTGTNLNNQLLYVLTSDYISAGQNAAVTTAEALMPMPVATVERYVNVQDGVAICSADIVHPVITTEQSATINADASLASSLISMPAFSRSTEYAHAHAEAFGELPMPTFFAYGTVTQSATAMTASAMFHDAQYNIGENNSADHMDASATMPGGIPVISRLVLPMVATVSAEIVDPVAQVQLLGVVNADRMTATAFSPAPPAYINKNDDLWFSLLRTQNVVNIPPSANSFLKLFNDVNANITPPDINLTYYYNQPNVYTGKTYNSDIPGYTGSSVTKFASLWANPHQSGASSAVPLLETGYFDNQNRRAVRFRNISMTDENRNTLIIGSNYSYTAEYIIKTDKANQIIAHGYSDNPSVSYYAGKQSSIGLYNGKVYVSTNFSGTSTNIHPLNTTLGTDATTNIYTNGYWTIGNKSIADNQWHHITIQVESNTSRVQIWIDGVLDIQRYNTGNQLPTELGYNSVSSTYASDFYISGYSLKPNLIIDQTSILTHYYATINYVPIKAAPMTASITSPVNSVGKGNRARALMLYWWPVTQQFNRTDDDGSQGVFDYETFANLYTSDYINNPPQQYYGWDVFPVDIQGYYVSDIANPEAYGGIENIQIATVNNTTNQFKYNRRGYFRDTLTDNRRYIDLLNDLDLSQFDCIFFRNFPDQPLEQQIYSTNESVDPYFGIIEKEIYEKFLVGLRAAVDSGISLYVTNPQLAIDLGIVDRVEIIDDLADTGGSDPYAPTIAPDAHEDNTGLTYWIDNHKNNRIVIKNTIEDMTNFPTTIWADAIFWKNSDAVDFGGADSESSRFEIKPNGLQVGDVMLMSDVNLEGYGPRLYQATPLANIKAGKAVTTFAPTIRRGLTEIDNPYRNHAVHIAVSPGDVLNGKQLGGKIFVSFTEIFPEAQGYLGQYPYYYQSKDHGLAELIQDKWINEAYNANAISTEQRNYLLASPDNLDRQLEAAIAANNQALISQINKKKYWDLNGDNILAQQNANVSYLALQSGAVTDTGSINKNNINDAATGNAVTYTKQVFFTFKYSRKYPTFSFQVPSMMTRGFWWLSKRLVPEGQIQRPVAMSAISEFVMPVVTADKILSYNAQAMTATANATYPSNYTSTDANIVTLPLYANATITSPTKLVVASPMTASAILRTDIATITSSVDEVVMYIYHTDPILYLREEVIK